jgi:SET domain-containing protein
MTYKLIKKIYISTENNIKPCFLNNIYLEKSKYGGIGVFANKIIKQDEVIEESPFLIIPTKDISDKNPLIDYVFKYDENNDCLVLGYGSLYNHKDTPNIQYYYNDDKTRFKYIALRDINKDEELCISYGLEYWSNRNIIKIK